MLGTKMLKSEFNQDKYAELATWCNNHEYKTIKDNGDYYEIVDCTPTQQQQNEVKKSGLLVQLQDVNTELQELDVAMMCDNGNDTTDVVINGNVTTMTGDEIDAYHTNKMQERVNILKELKALQ